ncbi:MAG: polymerase [Treponema sp.]|nr:polymerase [Treponema sp.]
MILRKIHIFLLIFIITVGVSAQPKTNISGTIEWDTMRLNSTVTLDLASAGLRLPSGRTQGESLLNEGFINLIKPSLLELQVDSSTTVADLIERGDFNLYEIEALALRANSVAPALSHDMRQISSNHSISLVNLSTALLRHDRPSPVMRILNPVSTAQYTGILIIASDSLPMHGMRSSAFPVPCLFPKIWDSEMNLIYDRNMLESRDTTMVRYSTLENIFQSNPSGLSAELRETVGERPLRVFARGVFGITPTDLIIERSDALLILSSDENRRLLSQGKVAFILNDSVLRYEFNE